MTDDHWMERALEMAQRAFDAGEVPVGAVLVKENRIVAEGWNHPISVNDPSAHAEIDVLRKAGISLGNYRLPGTTLYVTLEPCCMCVGAMIHARVERLVFGACDDKTGAAGGAFDLLQSYRHNHRVTVEGGVLEDHCRDILQFFFRNKRHQTS